MNKKNLIQYIKENNGYFLFANLSGYSLEDLQAIKDKIASRKRNEGINDHSLH
jgi:hypothetical protein